MKLEGGGGVSHASVSHQCSIIIVPGDKGRDEGVWCEKLLTPLPLALCEHIASLSTIRNCNISNFKSYEMPSGP